jgi:predicted nucleic acid-binding protein
LNVYLDTSVIVSMFTTDAHTPRAATFLARAKDRLALSDWVATEFTSALAIGIRIGRLTAYEREAAESAFQSWHDREPFAFAVEPNDIRVARSLIRLTAHPLRAGDALHIAIAQRMGCSLGTFDAGMRDAAIDLGMQAEDL